MLRTIISVFLLILSSPAFSMVCYEILADFSDDPKIGLPLEFDINDITYEYQDETGFPLSVVYEAENGDTYLLNVILSEILTELYDLTERIYANEGNLPEETLFIGSLEQDLDSLRPVFFVTHIRTTDPSYLNKTSPLLKLEEALTLPRLN